MPDPMLHAPLITFFCSLLHRLICIMLPVPLLFWHPFSRLPKTPCGVSLVEKYHNKSALEHCDVKITNNYVDGEPQVGNFPQQTSKLCNVMSPCLVLIGLQSFYLSHGTPFSTSLEVMLGDSKKNEWSSADTLSGKGVNQ